MQETTKPSFAEPSAKVHGDPLLKSSEESQHRTLSPQVVDSSTASYSLLIEEKSSSDQLFAAHEKSIEDASFVKKEDKKHNKKSKEDKEKKKQAKIKEGETGSEKKKKKDKKKDKRKEGETEIKKTKLENVDHITEAIERAADKAMSELSTVHPSHYVKEVIESDESTKQGIVKFEGHRVEHGTAKEFTGKDIGKSQLSGVEKWESKVEERTPLLQPNKQTAPAESKAKQAFETPILMPAVSQQDSSLKCSVPFEEHKDKTPFEARQSPSLTPGLSQTMDRKPLIESPLMKSGMEKSVLDTFTIQQPVQTAPILQGNIAKPISGDQPAGFLQGSIYQQPKSTLDQPKVVQQPVQTAPILQGNIAKPIVGQQATIYQQPKQASVLTSAKMEQGYQAKPEIKQQQPIVSQQQPTLVQNMVQPDMPIYSQTIPSYQPTNLSTATASNRMLYVQPHVAQKLPATQSILNPAKQQNLVQNLVQPDFMPTNSATFVPTTSSSDFAAPSSGEHIKPNIQRKSFVTNTTANASQPVSVDSIYSQTINARPSNK